MKGHVRLYVEGGGQGKDGKDQLRRGMDGFLAPLMEFARGRRWRWDLVMCEGRTQTWDAYSNALRYHAESINILLVDSEDPVTAPDPKQHLTQRDGWCMRDVDVRHLHLMAVCMETWIVADPDTVASYYGQGFLASALPQRANLEEEHKQQIYDALQRSTAHTGKGRYGKIRHAADLLARLDRDKVRARCSYAERLFREMASLITD